MTNIQLLTGSIANLRWFNESYPEIEQKFKGKFVAIKDEQILENSTSFDLLMEKLEKKGENSDELLIKRVSPMNEITIF